MSGRRRPARRARRSSGRSRPDNPASDARRARPAVQGIRLPGRIFFGGDRGPVVDSAGGHGARTCDSLCRNHRRSRRRAAWPQHLLRLRPGTQDRGHARFRALMELWIISVVLIAALAALLVAGVWIALTLLGVGWVAMVLFTHSPAGGLMATTVWGSSTSWALTALPLFIWMGEILFRTRISEDMFRGLAPWMAPLPGRLMHCNVTGCGIFAAISGSSAATAATIGRITIPELLKRGYDEAMTVGSLAGAGTLGLLIPPSIIMIVYGVAADVSIARLFVAGVLPGIMLMLMFSGYIVAWALFNPGKTPPRDQFATLGEKLHAARHLIPAVLLIGAVIGSIYTGVATPTEAAAICPLGAVAAPPASGALARVSLEPSGV